LFVVVPRGGATAYAGVTGVCMFGRARRHSGAERSEEPGIHNPGAGTRPYGFQHPHNP
jgi:hypothetical protein